MPILPGKGVEGQRRDAEFAAALNDVADRFGASSMPEDAGEPSSGGPSAVAIHDDGDMSGWIKSPHHHEPMAALRAPAGQLRGTTTRAYKLAIRRGGVTTQMACCRRNPSLGRCLGIPSESEGKGWADWRRRATSLVVDVLLPISTPASSLLARLAIAPSATMRS